MLRLQLEQLYALDIDHPEVQAYLKEVFDRVLQDWGFDLVKLDFLYGAAPFGNAWESRAGRMQRAMALLRSWCGDKLIRLRCAGHACLCIVDYCRIGCDVGLTGTMWYMRLFHRERVSTRQSIGNTIFRRQLNGRAYGSDPDVFFLREENCKLTLQKKADPWPGSMRCSAASCSPPIRPVAIRMRCAANTTPCGN